VGVIVFVAVPLAHPQEHLAVVGQEHPEYLMAHLEEHLEEHPEEHRVIYDRSGTTG
jgi:hypothetical protein